MTVTGNGKYWIGHLLRLKQEPVYGSSDTDKSLNRTDQIWSEKVQEPGLDNWEKDQRLDKADKFRTGGGIGQFRLGQKHV